MQLPLSTFSKLFPTGSVVLLAWTGVAQGAAINVREARTDIVDVAKDGLSRRISPSADDSWYTVAGVSASKRGETLAGRNGDLSRRVNEPVDDAWYTISAPSARMEHGQPEGGDSWYTLGGLETRETEGGDLARRMEDSENPWYTLAERAEESE